LRSRRGQQLTKGSLSQILRSRIYCGWVKSGSITARGTFEPLISEEIFEKCQDVLDGRARSKTHRQQHEDWPLRRFVLCGECGKPLTSGWFKNSKGKRYGYYFCEEKGAGPSKDARK
jgi:site-specific DNA recombinase